MTCSTASNSGKFARSGLGIGEGTILKGITFRLSDFFFNKGLEHESGFFIATPRILYQTAEIFRLLNLHLSHLSVQNITSLSRQRCTNSVNGRLIIQGICFLRIKTLPKHTVSLFSCSDTSRHERLP